MKKIIPGILLFFIFFFLFCFILRFVDKGLLDDVFNPFADGIFIFYYVPAMAAAISFVSLFQNSLVITLLIDFIYFSFYINLFAQDKGVVEFSIIPSSIFQFIAAFIGALCQVGYLSYKEHNKNKK